MSLILRVFVYLILAVCILLIAFLFSLPLIADTNTFKQQLTKQIQQRTGLELTINGELNVSLYPWLGIRTDAITLGQQAMGESPESNSPFFSADYADIRLKLIPLLQQRLEINELVLQAPRFHLHINEDGSSNFNLLAQKKKEETRSLLAQWWIDFTQAQLQGINLSDGKIIIDNLSKNQRWLIDDIRIELSALDTSAQYSFTTTAQYTINQQLPLDFSFQSMAEIDRWNNGIYFKDIISAMTQGQKSVVTSGDSLFVNLYELVVSDFEFVVDSGEALQIRVQPRIFMSPFDLDFGSKETSNIQFNLFEDRLNINAIGDIRFRSDQDILTYQGQIAMDNMNPKQIIDALRIDYAPAEDTVFRTLSFGSQFNGSQKGIYFNDAAVNLDESVFRGSIALIDFQQPQYRFDFFVDQIELSQYFSQTDRKKKALDKLAETNAYLSLLSLFKNIDANGFFYAQRLRHHNLDYQDVNLQVVANSRNVEASKVARLGEGRTDDSLTYTPVGDDGANIRIDKNYRGIHVGDLLQNLGYETDINEPGEVSVNINIVDSLGDSEILGKLVAVGESGARKVIGIGD